MTEQELFEKYSINELHSSWDDDDGYLWGDVFFLFFFMHKKLPTPNDTDMKYVLDFLDKVEDVNYRAEIRATEFLDLDNMLRTAKKMVYNFSSHILKAA